MKKENRKKMLVTIIASVLAQIVIAYLIFSKRVNVDVRILQFAWLGIIVATNLAILKLRKSSDNREG